MPWKHYPRVRGEYERDEHWVLHECDAPICALRKGETLGSWQASFLHLCGKTNVVAHATATSVEQAQRFCEKELRLIGWKWGKETAT